MASRCATVNRRSKRYRPACLLSCLSGRVSRTRLDAAVRADVPILIDRTTDTLVSANDMWCATSSGEADLRADLPAGEQRRVRIRLTLIGDGSQRLSDLDRDLRRRQLGIPNREQRTSLACLGRKGELSRPPLGDSAPQSARGLSPRTQSRIVQGHSMRANLVANGRPPPTLLRWRFRP